MNEDKPTLYLQVQRVIGTDAKCDPEAGFIGVVVTLEVVDLETSLRKVAMLFKDRPLAELREHLRGVDETIEAHGQRSATTTGARH